ncbi:CoA transferase [Phaeovibrio sulfidiphilus]|uniref:CoA transferase n=2 Tax=Phaeovibrio sulfidiphilus TaxID=1220600 RepID=A0A8J6YKX7_9PROT|nr:CoA transferase [Phaeovibrio sulfidiphilus]
MCPERAAPLPLNGILVVALEQAVSAPLCTARLADAGARVIKIERPGGDFARGYDAAANGLSSYFVWINRGKESVVLDLTAPADLAVFEGLLKKADVFVHNLRPGALARMGFADTRLQDLNPRLIRCAITGYREAGAFRDRKAYDLLIQAESGLCSVTGGPEAPGRAGMSVVDVATGVTAHAAILEALLQRQRTGVGESLSISLFDVMAEWMSVPLLNWEAGTPPLRMGLSHPSIAPYGVFRTREGRPILLSIQNEREWAVFCTHILGDSALIRDPRFCSNVARVENRIETDERVAASIGALSFEEAQALLNRHDIAYGVLNDMAGLSAHPELQRIAVETEVGPVSLPSPAPRFSGQKRRYGPVPALGESTAAVRALVQPRVKAAADPGECVP